jgi:prephenate dehydrogenase
VGIVGLGLVGGSLALAVRRRWPAALVIAVDRREVIERATVAHAIDVGADDLGMISEADLIVLAAPVRENERLLTTDLPRIVTRGSTITDVGSTKRGMLGAARGLPSHLVFVGGHPIAGAAVGGFEHARGDLFDGRPWILCAEEGKELSRVREFVSGLGANPVSMGAEEHDRVMAFLSHLPQLAASALMHVVAEHTGETWLPLAGRGFHDSTRLASSPPDIWKDVTNSNADEIRPALDALIEALHELREDLDRGEVLQRIFDSARNWKLKLERR